MVSFKKGVAIEFDKWSIWRLWSNLGSGFVPLFSWMFKYKFTWSVKWKLENSNVPNSLVSNNFYARIGGKNCIPYIIIEYSHQIGSFISNNRSSLDVIRPVSWIFQQKLVCFIGRISNDFWWNWHLFYRLCTIRLKTGKGYFINSFPAPPFCLQSTWKKNVYFYSITETELWNNTFFLAHIISVEPNHSMK